MDSQHLRELLQQHLNSDLPVKDLQALIDHLRENGDSKELLSVIEEALESGKFTGQADKVRKDRILQDVLRKAGKEEKISAEAKNSQPLIKRRMGMWKAAAAIIVLLAGASAYLIRKQAAHRENMINLAAKTDVMPGSNKAILTLTDGSSIELDTAVRGTLTRQGAAFVTKLNNGQLAYQVSNHTGADAVYNTVTTPRGGQYQIVLPDGTRAWLNAASSLHFPTSFNGKERVVEVTGEVYFEVAARENQPFKVVTQGMEVKVLGTHFNVNAYADEAANSTILLEGKVMVSHQGKNVLMSPGQQALVKKDIKIVPHADIETLMAWKEGKFSYNNMELETIMRQIARWYDVDIIFEDKITDSYSMEISRNIPLSKLLQFMELSGGVHFVINDRKIIVRK